MGCAASVVRRAAIDRPARDPGYSFVAKGFAYCFAPLTTGDGQSKVILRMSGHWPETIGLIARRRFEFARGLFAWPPYGGVSTHGLQDW